MHPFAVLTTTHCLNQTKNPSIRQQGMTVKRLEAIRFLLRAWRYRLKVEAEEIRHIRRSVSSGDTVIDVGAHKGAFTYWLSRSVGPKGRVLAFEPQPEVADYLRRAIRYFRLDNVEILETALSDQNGTATLFRATNAVSPGASLEVDPATAGDSMAVTLRPLDEVLCEKNIKSVRLIKCDAEGHELKVFQGAQKSLEKFRPILIFECETRHHWGRSIQVVFDFLYRYGYRGSFFSAGGIRPFPDDGKMDVSRHPDVFNYWFEDPQGNEQVPGEAA